MSEANNAGSTSGRSSVFFASFMTLIAAGIGFAVRGQILGDWSAQFGFTKGELGQITGGGLTGFGIIIIIGSFFADRVGYKPLMVLAFVLHIFSALVTIAATPIFESMGKDAAYACLFWGMFMFAVANGLCEAVINPLTATLYPKQKTHYLNILHAGWPGGLIVGGLLAFGFAGRNAMITQLRWEIPMLFFLVPVLVYGAIMFKHKFPVSEARAAGVDMGQMLVQFASPILLFLLLLHAMVGYVELGTDSWITNIMNNVISGKAILLFIYTSGLMFILRFFAGPIVEKINPVGLLLASALLAAGGLYWLGSGMTGMAIFLAGTVYGIGKTFFWPTMLGVVGEQFPKGGAITMGMMGGIGMLSAGLLGGPGIGYKQDYYATEYLTENNSETYERYRSEKEYGFLMFPKISGLDGKKVGDLEDKIANNGELTPTEQADKGPIKEATIYGGRMALKWTAVVPLAMAVGFLILALYYRAKGGYQVEVLHGAPPEGEHYTGGVEGPVE